MGQGQFHLEHGRRRGVLALRRHTLGPPFPGFLSPFNDVDPRRTGERTVRAKKLSVNSDSYQLHGCTGTICSTNVPPCIRLREGCPLRVMWSVQRLK
jgi:hypothetical protein